MIWVIRSGSKSAEREDLGERSGRSNRGREGPRSRLYGGTIYQRVVEWYWYWYWEERRKNGDKRCGMEGKQQKRKGNQRKEKRVRVFKSRIAAGCCCE